MTTVKAGTVTNYVAALPDAQRGLAERVCAIIDAELPGLGAVWHGHPVWSLGDAPGRRPAAMIRSYPRYLTFGLFLGKEIVDRSGRLDTRGSMAHVKLAEPGDIDETLFRDWLRQVAQLER
jgi:hypothetical protein